MSLTSTVATLANAGTDLPLPPLAFGLIAFASFLVLLGVLWAFRNTAVKYDTPTSVRHDDQGGRGDAHGSTDPGGHH